MCMLRSCSCTGTWTFHLHGRFNTRTFRHEDILAQGIFATMDISALDILAPVLLCRNVPVSKHSLPKNPCVKKSMYRNIHGDKMSMCRNTYRAETCMCGNVPVMKYLCRNVSGQNVSCQNGGKPVYYYSLLITSKVQSVPKLCCIHSTGILFS